MMKQYSLSIYWIVVSLLLSLLPLFGQALLLLPAVSFFQWWIQQRYHQEQEALWMEIRSNVPPPLQVGVSSTEELRQRVAELWVEREQMDLVLSEIREGVLAISPDNLVLLANDRAKELLSFSDGLLEEKLNLNLAPKELKRVLEQCNEHDYVEELWKIGQKPNRRYIQIFGLPMQNNRGILLVLRDRTKLRRLERIRRDFIANISHELRTPVSVILMNTEALLDPDLVDSKIRKRFLAAIQRNSMRLSRLLEDLLNLSQMEAGQYKMECKKERLLPLVKQVTNTLHEKLAQKEQRVFVQIPKEMVAWCDRYALEQVLTNLIENAHKYTQNQSTIVIRSIEEDETILLEIEDDGPGVEEKHQPRLFERFYRVDKGRSRAVGGTGLGLSIVRHLMETMNGSAGMRSAQPNGAIFWLQLPVADPNKEKDNG